MIGTRVLTGHLKNGQFPFPCLWPLCIRNQNSEPKQNHPEPPVFVFFLALDLPLLMAIRRRWTKPGRSIKATLVTGELTETTSLMPLILSAGIVISATQSVELLKMTPIISISPIMKDTMASTEEPIIRSPG